MLENKKLYEKIEQINLKYNVKNNEKFYGVILSVSDFKTKAKVSYSIGKNIFSLEDAISKIEKKIEENYEVKCLRLDFIDSMKLIKIEELQNLINDTHVKNSFKYGIMIGNIVLSQQEINSNGLIDYDLNCLNLFKINEYLIYSGEETINQIPNTINIFTVAGYFCNSKNLVFKLEKKVGRRKVNIYNKKNIEIRMNNATNYLYKLMDEKGKFIYGWYALINKKVKGYNILRHAGTTWALILQYNSEDEIKKEKINLALEYLCNNTVNKNENISFCLGENEKDIKLGGNALSSIAMCEYYNKFGDSKYIKFACNLCNGIINLQNEDGSFNHTLYINDFKVKDKFSIIYYDGEATLALCKLYAVTQDEKYLKSALKAVDYFIKSNYEIYKDHWISYTMNEIINYSDSEKYYEFALKNIQENLGKIYKRKKVAPTDLELLMQGFESYQKIKKKVNNIAYLEKFDVTEFYKVLKYRADFQFNSYMFPEIAMFLDRPKKFVYSFYIREDYYRIRIDDIQHSLIGYYYYCKNLDKIVNVNKD